MCTQMHTKEKPREDTARGLPSANQGESSHQNLTLPDLNLELQPLELRKLISVIFLLFKPPGLWYFAVAARGNTLPYPLDI